MVGWSGECFCVWRGGVWSAVQWVREQWGIGLKNDMSACANIFFLGQSAKEIYLFCFSYIYP